MKKNHEINRNSLPKKISNDYSMLMALIKFLEYNKKFSTVNL